MSDPQTPRFGKMTPGGSPPHNPQPGTPEPGVAPAPYGATAGYPPAAAPAWDASPYPIQPAVPVVGVSSYADSPSYPAATPYGSAPASPHGALAGMPMGGPGTRFCPNCGGLVVITAVICTRCGSPVGRAPKSKGAAVVLAVFLSFWTWCYTYDRNAAKFWIGFGLCVFGFLLGGFTLGVSLIINFAVWMWAIIDAATMSDDIR